MPLSTCRCRDNCWSAVNCVWMKQKFQFSQRILSISYNSIYCNYSVFFPYFLKNKHFIYIFFFMIKKIQLQNIQIFVYFQPSKGSVSSTISYNLCFLNVLSSNLFLRIHCSFLLYALWRDLVQNPHSLNFHLLCSLHLSIQSNIFNKHLCYAGHGGKCFGRWKNDCLFK